MRSLLEAIAVLSIGALMGGAIMMPIVLTEQEEQEEQQLEEVADEQV